MANELTLNVSAEFDDGDDTTDSIEIVDYKITLATVLLHRTVQSVGTSEEALLVGDVATRGFCLIVNKDPTNYVEVKTGTSGTIFAKLWPKGDDAGINFCVLHLGSGAQTPYVIANTAACKIDIFLCPL